jgi:primase-polymerase (primpol)-like protein
MGFYEKLLKAKQKKTVEKDTVTETVVPVVDETELVAMRKKIEALEADNKKATTDRENSEKQRVADRINHEIVQLAQKHKAHNPQHVAELKSKDFILHNNAVVLKSDPNKTLESSLTEWFTGEGKYVVSAQVPSGAGVASTAVPAVKPATDVKTPEGRTRFASEQFFKR